MGLMTGIRTGGTGSADATKTMTASAGRANWVGKDSYDGVPDPGAAAVALVLEAAAKAAV